LEVEGESRGEKTLLCKHGAGREGKEKILGKRKRKEKERNGNRHHRWQSEERKTIENAFGHAWKP